MSEGVTTSCPNCAVLELKLQELVERVAALEAELAKARKNSSNSSKPPSSDIVQPPKPQGSGKKKGKRKRMWTRCFRSSLYTLFKIDPSRSSRVLLEVLEVLPRGV